MKLLISNIEEIVNNEHLSIFDRGVLITIILMRDNYPKLHLAKLKVKLKFDEESKRSLIKLQDLGFIKWSGYGKAKQDIRNKKEDPKIIEAIDFMNRLYHRKFNPKNAGTTKELRNRLAEHSLDDIKLVIANRWKAWKDDTMMEKHLNPGTIFRSSKFPKYLEEAQRTKEGKSLLSVEDINLKDGDLITYEISKKFIDSDTYTLTQHTIAYSFEGNGKVVTIYGKDIKRKLKMQLNRITNGEKVDFVYRYKEV